MRHPANDRHVYWGARYVGIRYVGDDPAWKGFAHNVEFRPTDGWALCGECGRAVFDVETETRDHGLEHAADAWHRWSELPDLRAALGIPSVGV